MKDFLVICGPTAAGKSSVAVELAERLGGEIVSADSMQLYRGLDIGTDKPPPELTGRVPHHMIDVVDPGEGYSAARYEREAGEIIDRLLARKKLPIVVGGSGLYIRILINGIFPAPPASVAIRRRLKDESRDKGAHALYERLLTVDPEYARVAAPTDLRRIVRALEVFELTGATLSSWHERHRSGRKTRDPFMAGIRRSREDLYRRIDRRVDEMFARGLIDEVRVFCEKGFSGALRELRPLGYIEALDYLEGRIDAEEAIRLTKRNSRRFAKRQMTWFRKEDVNWIDLDPSDEAPEATAKIMAAIPWSVS
ncbi:MAG: tRNA (adenosine(37)-N6)-dimethylallyltransferase MiaA [Candidatus Lindowbacteria bacterium]|nr:tRNA (adenosine(37)-N6)-dimethylallyltransferase MiaA [Candidatus Lindowbacteria bacterium]